MAMLSFGDGNIQTPQISHPLDISNIATAPQDPTFSGAFGDAAYNGIKALLYSISEKNFTGQEHIRNLKAQQEAEGASSLSSNLGAIGGELAPWLIPYAKAEQAGVNLLKGGSNAVKQLLNRDVIKEARAISEATTPDSVAGIAARRAIEQASTANLGYKAKSIGGEIAALPVGIAQEKINEHYKGNNISTLDSMDNQLIASAMVGIPVVGGMHAIDRLKNGKMFTSDENFRSTLRNNNEVSLDKKFVQDNVNKGRFNVVGTEDDGSSLVDVGDGIRIRVKRNGMIDPYNDIEHNGVVAGQAIDDGLVTEKYNLEVAKVLADNKIYGLKANPTHAEDQIVNPGNTSWDNAKAKGYVEELGTNPETGKRTMVLDNGNTHIDVNRDGSFSPYIDMKFKTSDGTLITAKEAVANGHLTDANMRSIINEYASKSPTTIDNSINAFNGIKNGIAKLFGKGNKAEVKNTNQTLFDEKPKAPNKVSTAFNTAVEQITAHTTEGQFIKQATETVQSKAQETFKRAKVAYRKAKEEFYKATPELKEKAGIALAQAKATYSKATEALKPHLKDTFDSVKDLYSLSRDELSKGLKKLKTSIDDNAPIKIVEYRTAIRAKNEPIDDVKYENGKSNALALDDEELKATISNDQIMRDMSVSEAKAHIDEYKSRQDTYKADRDRIDESIKDEPSKATDKSMATHEEPTEVAEKPIERPKAKVHPKPKAAREHMAKKAEAKTPMSKQEHTKTPISKKLMSKQEHIDAIDNADYTGLFDDPVPKPKSKLVSAHPLAKEYDEIVKDFPADNKPEVHIYSTDDWKYNITNQEARAAYNLNDDVIYLREDATKADILHELGHALTVREYRGNTEFKTRIDEILKGFKFNTLSNEEILAEMFTNEELFKALNRADEDNATPWDKLVTAIRKYFNKAFGAIEEGSRLDRMIDTIEIYNGKYTKAIDNDPIVYREASNTTYPHQAFMDKADDLASEKLIESGRFVWGKINQVYDRYLQGSGIKEFIAEKAKGIGETSLIRKIMVDYGMVDDDFIGKIQEIANARHKLDQTTLSEREAIAKHIGMAIDGTEANHTQLSKSIVAADIQSVPNIMEMFDDGFKNIDRDIVQAYRDIGAVEADMKRALDAQVNQLLGKKAGANALNNSEYIVYNYMDVSKMTAQQFQNTVEAIDRYTSLKALKASGTDDILKLDKDTFDFIIKTHKRAIELSNKSGMGGAYRKGYMDIQLSPNIEVKHVSKDEYEANRIKNGYTKIGETPDGVVVKMESDRVSYDQGIIPNKQEHSMGANRFNSPEDFYLNAKIKPNGDMVASNKRAMAYIEKLGDAYQPLQDKNGRIINARIMMETYDKINHLKGDAAIGTVLANAVMSAKRNLEYNQFIKEIDAQFSTKVNDNTAKEIKAGIDDSANHIMLRGFPVDIEKKLGKEFLEEHYELVDKSVMPKSMKDISYVRKGYKDEFLGYKNELMSDNRQMRLMELHWRDAINLFREKVVGRNPIAMVTNIAGNILSMAGEGIPVAHMLKYGKEARENIPRLIKTVGDIEVARIKGDDALVAKLENELKTNPAYDGLNEGFYQSLVDDFYRGDISNVNRVSEKTENFIKGKMTKYLGELRANKYFDGLCNIALTQGSNAGRTITKFLEATDHTARYITYKSKIASGMAPAEAAKLSREMFVDYRKTLPKEINWLRKSGIVPFATFAYRMQPVIARQIKNHPMRVAALYGTYMAMADEGNNNDYVMNMRVGGWMPQNVLIPVDGTNLLNSPITSTYNGHIPTEMAVPEVWQHASELNLAALMGIRLAPEGNLEYADN